jgi:hypothetical protein
MKHKQLPIPCYEACGHKESSKSQNCGTCDGYRTDKGQRRQTSELLVYESCLEDALAACNAVEYEGLNRAAKDNYPAKSSVRDCRV